MLSAVVSLIALLAPPVELDSIGLEHAHALSGRLVVASLVADGAFPYPEYGIKSVGTTTRDDGAERHAVFPVRRYDVKTGELVKARGPRRKPRRG